MSDAIIGTPQDFAFEGDWTLEEKERAIEAARQGAREAQKAISESSSSDDE